MRSKLFVPGSRPELFAKALASAADAISFDLEDSVPDECKAQAREAVAGLLRTSALREVAKLILVRSNAPFQIVGDARIERAIAAADQIDAPAHAGNCSLP